MNSPPSNLTIQTVVNAENAMEHFNHSFFRVNKKDYWDRMNRNMAD